MTRLQKPIFLSILIGLSIYIGAMFYGDFEATKDAMWSVGATGWSVILTLSLLNYLLRYYRWQWYLGRLDNHNVPQLRHLAYYFCGFALSTTPGKAGETVRSLYLKRHDVGFAKTISVFFVERFQDLLAIVLLSVAAAFMFDGYQWLVIGAVVAVFISLPVLHSRYVLRILLIVAKKLPNKLNKLMQRFVELLESSAVLLKNRELVGGISIGLLAWFLEAFGFWYLLNMLGQDVSLLAATSIYGIAVLIGALSFLPGGLGSTEAVMGLLLISSGVAEPVAVAATLICRIATLWFAVIIGLIVTGFLATRGITPLAPGQSLNS